MPLLENNNKQQAPWKSTDKSFHSQMKQVYLEERTKERISCVFVSRRSEVSQVTESQQ